jgi:hypothetical protein
MLHQHISSIKLSTLLLVELTIQYHEWLLTSYLYSERQSISGCDPELDLECPFKRNTRYRQKRERNLKAPLGKSD